MSSIHKIALAPDTKKDSRDIQRKVSASQLPFTQRHSRTHHKNITGLWHHSALSQELEQIPELAMDITAYCDRGRHRLNIRFFHENGADGITEDFHVGLWEMLAREELRDPLVGS